MFLSDPADWTKQDVQTWMNYTLSEFNITDTNNLTSRFEEDGAALTIFTEEEFVNRLGKIGEIIFAKFEILKMIFGGVHKQGMILQNVCWIQIVDCIFSKTKKNLKS